MVMKKFNGITFVKNWAWDELLKVYENQTAKEVEAKLEAGIYKAFKKMGTEPDEEIYTLSVNDLADVLDLDRPFISVLVLNRWSNILENILENVFIIGTEDCDNCGSYLEHWDEDILKCANCGNKQTNNRGDF
jgi:hypothetical protein